MVETKTGQWQTKLEKLSEGAFAYVQASGGTAVSNAGFIKGKEFSVGIDTLSLNHTPTAF